MAFLSTLVLVAYTVLTLTLAVRTFKRRTLS